MQKRGSARRKPLILAVDDKRLWRKSTKCIATEQGFRARTAFDVTNAKYKLARRLKAIKLLKQRKLLLLARVRSPARKRLLQRQIRALARAEKSPFDVIVSDINMPEGEDASCIPEGVDFALHIQENFPRQKVIIHSDDRESAMIAKKVLRNRKRGSVPFVDKLDFDFKEPLAKELRRATRARAPKK